MIWLVYRWFLIVLVILKYGCGVVFWWKCVLFLEVEGYDVGIVWFWNRDGVELC